MHNVMSYTYIDGFTVNTTTQDICNSQNKHETNTTAFTTEHNRFEQLLFFFLQHIIMFINLLVNELYFEF